MRKSALFLSTALVVMAAPAFAQEAPAPSAELVVRQGAVVEAALATGAELHRHYRPGVWLPHLTLAPRLHTADLPVLARIVYDVLPVTAPVSRAALIETSTGARYALDHLV